MPEGSDVSVRDHDLRRLAGWVANIPDREPPDTLIAAVMGGLQPKKLPWNRRIQRRVRTFLEAYQLRLIPVGVSIAALLVAGWVFFQFPSDPGGRSLVATPPALGPTHVVFTLDMPQASRVDIIGSFNRWTPDGFRMQRDEKRGLWVLTVPLKRGRHEYTFLVDEQHIVPDPRALMHEDDGFGNQNAILIINGEHGHEESV